MAPAAKPIAMDGSGTARLRLPLTDAVHVPVLHLHAVQRQAASTMVHLRRPPLVGFPNRHLRRPPVVSPRPEGAQGVDATAGVLRFLMRKLEGFDEAHVRRVVAVAVFGRDCVFDGVGGWLEAWLDDEVVAGGWGRRGVHHGLLQVVCGPGGLSKGHVKWAR